MPIAFSGINTGLPPNLIEQLIEVEKIPIKNIEKKREQSSTKLELVNKLEESTRKIKASIAELAGTRGFSDIKFISGDTNIVQGTVDPEFAAPGSWNIEVLQLAQKAAAVTNGFPDKDRTEIGVGYFSFETPEGTREVYINGDNNTLDGAAKAINGANIGIRATVINDRKDKEYPFRLVLSGENVGDDNQIEYPRLYFLDGDMDLYFDEERSAQNGVIKLDGFEMEISDNKIVDLIPGVTLDLKQASPGRQVNVTVKEDIDAVTGKVKDFVSSMNEVFSFIQSQNKMNEHTDTSRTLGGDSILRTIEARLRRLVLDPQYGVQGSITRLNQLGIAFNRNGLLDFDADKFHALTSRTPGDVQAFFAGDGFKVGFIPTLKRDIDSILNQTFGPIANRKQSLENRISQFDKSVARKEEQLAKKEVQLRQKFSRLEQSMSKLKSQGSAMASFAASAGASTGLNLGAGSLTAG